MPPKNKKDTEEEAKKLEEERKRREEEEARLEAERKKYAVETLPTGLFLPASAQLIVDFPSKNRQFVTERLTDALQEMYPSLAGSSRFEFIMKELHYYLKDAAEVFGVPAGPEQVMPHRILVAIMCSTLLHQDSQCNGAEKSRESDERHIKDLVIKHCQKVDGRALLNKAEGMQILKYASEKYLSRFLLIKMFDKFSKKPIEKSMQLFLETPTQYTNEKDTIFVSLDQKKE